MFRVTTPKLKGGRAEEEARDICRNEQIFSFRKCFLNNVHFYPQGRSVISFSVYRLMPRLQWHATNSFQNYAIGDGEWPFGYQWRNRF
jgi:hypothetical protein